MRSGGLTCLSPPDDAPFSEITTTIRSIPIEVTLGPAEKLPRKCVINCDNIRTIAKQNLSARNLKLPPKRVGEIKRAVGYAFACDELIDTIE